ncbi:hypothetical protein Tco_1149079 [Tanacetum coccineum]
MDAAWSQKFPDACPLALRLLERMLAFEPKDRPISKEALSDPYSKNLAKVERGAFWFSYNRGAAVSAMEGHSREAIDAGNKVHVVGVMPCCRMYTSVWSDSSQFPPYEVKNMYLMGLLNLSARYCDIDER